MRPRIHASATLVLLILSLAACDDTVSAPTAGAAALSAARARQNTAAVVIMTSDTTLRVNEVGQYAARIDFIDGSSIPGKRRVDWRSLDTSVVEFISSDRAIGRRSGITRVIAAYGAKADTLRLYVGTAAGADTGATDTTPSDSTGTPADTGSTGVDSTATPGDTGSTSEPTDPVVISPTPTGPSEVAELPRSRVDTRLVAPTGRQLYVKSGGLQAALDSARMGDVLLLPNGSTFTGHFRLRRKSGDGWITIKPASDAGLPAPGVRMTPSAAQSASLPKILTPDVSPVITTDTGAHHYRIIGVEISAVPGLSLQYGLVKFGGSGTDQNSLTKVPHHLILDRVYAHGQSGMNLKRCVTLNSAWSAVIDSHLSRCHAAGQDAQAILGWNGPGPFKIVNNHLEGSGETVMFGGADPSISGLIPSDIEVRNNYFYKPASWKGVWQVKVGFELKNAQRVLVEGNVFDGNWQDAQTGFMWNIKSANQSGTCGWCVTQHVTMRYNLVTNTGGGMSVSGGEAYNGGTVGQTNHITIVDNRFDKINVPGTPYTGTGRPFQLSRTSDLAIAHNTINNANSSSLAMFVATMGARFTFMNNAGYKGEYGLPGLGTYAPNAVISGNAFVGTAGSTTYSAYGAGNIIVSSLSAATSALGTDARPIGCDNTLLTQSTQAVGP